MMTGKELIELIKDRNLEDFEIRAVFTDGYDGFPNVRVLELKGLADIGYSDKRATLDGVLDE